MGFTSEVKLSVKLPRFWSIDWFVIWRIGFVSRMSGMESWSVSRNPICPSVPMLIAVLPCVIMIEFEVEFGFGEPSGSFSAFVVG